MGYRDGEAYVERDVLWRIVALLFVVAGLAEDTFGVPARRRRQVLEYLASGEAEVRALVIAMASGMPMQRDVSHAPADAARLAANFRALALLLSVMLAQTWRFARAEAECSPKDRGVADVVAGFGCRTAERAPDTS